LIAQEVLQAEPGLAQHPTLLGGIVYPSEGYGNCALFTKQLKSHHQQNGVHYWFNTHVLSLEAQGHQWRVHTQARAGTLASVHANEVAGESNDALTQQPKSGNLFDAVIVTAGASSNALLSPLGLNFPTLKTHAYSVTLPMHERIDSPSRCVLDVATGNTLTPIGNRVRVSGQHQLGGVPKNRSPAYKALGQNIQHWYPFSSKVSEASYDVSTGCITSDSKPFVGRTRLPGLWVNFAHGNSHWALSFGCAQALADELMQATGKFDLSPFSPSRFD
jgi:D-amino-acid dehydrogenase